MRDGVAHVDAVEIATATEHHSRARSQIRTQETVGGAVLDDSGQVTASSSAQLKALTDSLRSDLLDFALDRAATVAELAQAVGQPKAPLPTTSRYCWKLRTARTCVAPSDTGILAAGTPARRRAHPPAPVRRHRLRVRGRSVSHQQACCHCLRRILPRCPASAETRPDLTRRAGCSAIPRRRARRHLRHGLAGRGRTPNTPRRGRRIQRARRGTGTGTHSTARRVVTVPHMPAIVEVFRPA